jgi:catechol 2,3-dioxygenase-like lactoylglutathione lyase family enzyme
MPVRLHHIVIDAHDLPRLARFWTQALGWKIISERGRDRQAVTAGSRVAR